MLWGNHGVLYSCLSCTLSLAGEVDGRRIDPTDITGQRWRDGLIHPRFTRADNGLGAVSHLELAENI